MKSLLIRMTSKN